MYNRNENPPSFQESSSPRIVLDTSAVLMPVIRLGSQHRWLREFWHAGRITPLVSADTETEFRRKLGSPKLQVPAEFISELSRDYLEFCTVVVVPDPPPETPQAET